MEIAAGGELYDFLSDRKCLEELEARRVFRQIATAVYYCHKNNICHRDLKLENILLDENGNAKVLSWKKNHINQFKTFLNNFVCGLLSEWYAHTYICIFNTKIEHKFRKVFKYWMYFFCQNVKHLKTIALSISIIICEKQIPEIPPKHYVMIFIEHNFFYFSKATFISAFI